jgi:hypothetical protein
VAVAALSGGRLVAVEQGGRVFLLEPTAFSSALVEGATLVALTGIPMVPTGVDVVTNGADWNAVVSSEEGLYVFGLPRDVALRPLTPEGPVVGTSALPGSPLAIGVTLHDGPLPGGAPPEASPFTLVSPAPTDVPRESLLSLLPQAQAEPLLVGPLTGRAGTAGTPAGGGDEAPPVARVPQDGSLTKGPPDEQEEEFLRSTRRRLEGFEARRVEDEDLNRSTDPPVPPEGQGEPEPASLWAETWSIDSGWLRAPVGLSQGGFSVADADGKAGAAQALGPREDVWIGWAAGDLSPAARGDLPWPAPTAPQARRVPAARHGLADAFYGENAGLLAVLAAGGFRRLRGETATGGPRLSANRAAPLRPLGGGPR